MLTSPPFGVSLWSTSAYGPLSPFAVSALLRLRSHAWGLAFGETKPPAQGRRPRRRPAIAHKRGRGEHHRALEVPLLYTGSRNLVLRLIYNWKVGQEGGFEPPLRRWGLVF